MSAYADLSDHVIRVFLTLSQKYFSLAKDLRPIPNSVGYKHHLDADEQDKNTIWISDSYPEVASASELRPAIVVKRGEVVDNVSFLGGDIQEMDWAAGSYTESSLVGGSIQLLCLSRQGVEAEAVAFELFSLIRLMREEIIVGSQIHSIQKIRMGEEKDLEIQGDRTEWMAVPLDVMYTSQLDMSVELADPEALQGFDITS